MSTLGEETRHDFLRSDFLNVQHFELDAPVPVLHIRQVATIAAQAGHWTLQEEVRPQPSVEEKEEVHGNHHPLENPPPSISCDGTSMGFLTLDYDLLQSWSAGADLVGHEDAHFFSQLQSMASKKHIQADMKGWRSCVGELLVHCSSVTTLTHPIHDTGQVHGIDSCRD